jgi:hypothetical protein
MRVPVRRSVWAICAASVWPPKGLPGMSQAPSTNWPPRATAWVVASETLTPNSERVRAFPLSMHST